MEGGLGREQNVVQREAEDNGVSPAATQAWNGHQRGVNPDLGELQWWLHPHPTFAAAANLHMMS